MKRALVLLVLCACSNEAPRMLAQHSAVSPRIERPRDMSAGATGETYDIRIDGDAISFCDRYGARSFNALGQAVADDRPCGKKVPALSACGDAKDNVSTRMPMFEGNFQGYDVVDTPGQSYAQKGLVHDCVLDDRYIFVSSQQVSLIDMKTDTSEIISDEYGERVAMSKDWLVWVSTDGVHAKHR